MQAQTGRVAVIMFHDVVSKPPEHPVWFDCTLEEFQKDMDEIVQNGFTVLSLDQLYDHLTKGTTVPPKSVVLTFDDNCQGFYDNALPILKEHKFPAAMFVHTKYVGSAVGRPKMTWEELKELHDGGLVTVCSHTVTHPPDLKVLPPEEQRKELVDSMADLKQHLGSDIPYLAYPDGSNDVNTQEYARDAGYKMSFSTESGTAEGSPNIQSVCRYEAKKFDQALKDLTQEVETAPVAIADLPLKKADISCEAGAYDGTKLVLLRGGTPVSVLADGRMPVGDFVAQNNGVAGINGSFFVMADVASNDNRLIGPFRPQNRATFISDDDAYRVTKLKDRPMVVWGPSRMAIIPFQPGAMNQEPIYKGYMPDYTDAFLAGAWIVHEGKPRVKDDMAPFSSKDIMDMRKRAFFGITKDGEIICGASQGSITTEELGRAAAAAGAFEAVLLDSGFSTSVVFDGQILASGHSNIEHASRPVPHAIVLQGTKGAADLGSLKTVPAVLSPPPIPGQPTEGNVAAPGLGTAPDMETAGPDVVQKPHRKHRRHRRR